MIKLIADIHKDPNGNLRRRYYYVNDDGELNRAVTMTLLMLIAESMSPSDGELEALLTKVERGEYASPNPCLPDWSVNDKCIWFGPPVASVGCVRISNEYIDEYSPDDGGQATLFTVQQCMIALKHWHQFHENLRRDGAEAWIGRTHEVAFHWCAAEGL